MINRFILNRNKHKIKHFYEYILIQSPSNNYILFIVQNKVFGLIERFLSEKLCIIMNQRKKRNFYPYFARYQDSKYKNNNILYI